MYLLVLCTPGEGAQFVRTMLACWGYLEVKAWKLPTEGDILIVDIPGVSAGRQLMADLAGTLGLIDMWPLNFRADVVALAPQLRLPCLLEAS